MTHTDTAIKEIAEAVSTHGYHANADMGYDHEATKAAFEHLVEVCNRHGITTTEARAIRWQPPVKPAVSPRQKIAAARKAVREHAIGIRIATAIGDTARVAKLRTAIAVERARQHHAMKFVKLAGV